MNPPILLSKKWAAYLISLPETGMGYQVVSVTLNDGRRFAQAVIDSGYITRVCGYKHTPFSESEIAQIKVSHDKWNWKLDNYCVDTVAKPRETAYARSTSLRARVVRARVPHIQVELFGTAEAVPFPDRVPTLVYFWPTTNDQGPTTKLPLANDLQTSD
jgi:hypothetical protein